MSDPTASAASAVQTPGAISRLLASPAALGLISAAMGAASFGLALLLQHVWRMEPCPLCIFQRVAVIASSAAASGAAACARRAPKAASALFALGLLLALAGLGIAGKHMHVMWFPQDVSCGPDLEYLMDAFPPSKWIPQVFSGSAECEAAGKQLVLGLPIPVWSAGIFAAQAALAALALRARSKAKRGASQA